MLFSGMMILRNGGGGVVESHPLKYVYVPLLTSSHACRCPGANVKSFREKLEVLWLFHLEREMVEIQTGMVR